MRTLRLILAICLLLAACSQGRWDGLLFDFESEAELDQFHWRCGQLFSLSPEHVTHGLHSLRLELYPVAYPGLHPKIEQHDWSGFKTFCLDVYNPQPETLPWGVRIDDVSDRADWRDRYNHTFQLQPGQNRLRIPLTGLQTSGTGRVLDTGDVWAVYMFLPRPDSKKVLYIDHLRLE
jgi:hypothetical protein